MKIENNNYKVSIIIPAYNIEKYIGKCLDSVINQTYKNLEIIVVNDESTDGTQQIIDKYANQDHRIKKYLKENGGLSDTRNFGIAKATGELIAFVDGDDWIDLNCIEKCVSSFEENTDILMFPYIREYNDKSIRRFLFEREKEFKKNDILDELIAHLIGLRDEELKQPERLEILSTAWGKLYRRKIIADFKFVDTKTIGTEDAWFNINVFYNAKNIKYIDNTFYHYRKENNSSLTKTYNKYLFKRWSTLYMFIENFIDEKNLSEDYKKFLNNRITVNLLSLCLNIVNSNLTFGEKYKEIKELLNQGIYKKSLKEFAFDKLDLKWRIYYKSCYKKRYILVMILTKLGERIKKFY